MKLWIPLIILVVVVAWLATDGFDLTSPPPPPEEADGRPEEDPRAPGTGPDAPEPPEPDPDQKAAPERGEVVVIVRTDTGQPAAGAVVVLEPGGVTRTDEEGVARMPAPGGQGRIRVVYPGAVPLSVDASLSPGTITLDLRAGLEVEGRLIVNGGQPPEPVDLRLTSHGGLGSEPAVPEMTCRVDEGGIFRFIGLPDGWAGRVVVPHGYEVLSPEPEGRTIPVTAPTRGLEVRVHRHHVLTGRVVRAGGEVNVADARVELKFETEGGGGSLTRKTDAEGRFRAQVPWCRIQEAYAVISDPEGTSRIRIDINLSRLTSDHDLGSIELPAFREVTLLVSDEKGKPIGDARVAPVKGRTGADGLVAIRVTPDITRLRVGKPGYRVAEVDLSSRRGGPIPVTLATGNLLEIRIVGPGGRPPLRVAVLLSSPSPLFDAPNGGLDEELQGTGVGRSGSARYGAGAPGSFYFAPDREGRILLSGIRPGVVLSVKAIDHTLDAVLAEETVTAQESGRQAVTLRVTVPERVLAGQVVDEEGGPIGKARVKVGRAYAWTDAAGRFRIGSLRVPTVPIVVEKGGRAPFAQAEFPVSEKARITLAVGHRVTVLVTDPAGKPVPSAEVEVESGGRRDLWEAEPQRDGGFVLEDLPAGPVMITAIVAGRRFDLRHDTAHDSAVIRVPALGSAVVRWRFKLEAPVIHQLRLEPTGSEGNEVAVDVHIFPKRTDWEVSLPAVLPGRYRVYLEAWDDESEEDDDYRTVLTGPTIRVRVGETAEAELTR